MTPQTIITEARYILNDTNVTGAGYRNSDTELLDYVNGSLKECAVLQPTLFSKVAQHTCTTSQCEQAISFTDAIALLEVLAIQNGAALTPFDLKTMDAFNPGWRADTVGAARQWSRYPDDPLRFFVYPAAPATSQILDVRYARNPAEFAIGATITELPTALETALVEYVVYRAASKDDEHVSSGRAMSSYQTFVSKVKG